MPFPFTGFGLQNQGFQPQQQQGWGYSPPGFQNYAPAGFSSPYQRGNQAFDPMQVQGQGKFPAMATSYGQMMQQMQNPQQGAMTPSTPRNPANIPPVAGAAPVAPVPPLPRHTPQEMAAHLLRMGRVR
jgi:hypothetical protein